MSRAVVFYGSMREFELSSKSWHVLGDADYFLVTWDQVNPHISSRKKPWPFELSKFPRKVKASILINFEDYRKQLIDQSIPTDSGLLYILYHWSLVKNLPGIHRYDEIIITRSDAFYSTGQGRKWHPEIFENKVSFSWDETTDYGVNDWIIGTTPAGLEVLSNLYYNAISTRDFLTEDNRYKIIHAYLMNIIKMNPESYACFNAPLMHLIRPNYPETLLSMDFSPELIYRVTKHALRYERQFGIIPGIEERIILAYKYALPVPPPEPPDTQKT